MAARSANTDHSPRTSGGSIVRRMSLFPPLPPRYDVALRDATEAREVRHRLAALEVLGRHDVEGDRSPVIEALTRGLRDADASVRAAALSGLGRRRAREAASDVVARLDDESREVRELAVIVLGDLGGEEAREAVGRMLRDPRPEMRFQALLSYAHLAGEEARPAVAVALADDDAELRLQALDAALELPSDDDTRRRVQKLLRDDDVRVRRSAALVLAHFGDAAGVSVLRGMLRDDPRIFEVMKALGDLRAREALPELRALERAFFRPAMQKAAAAAARVRIGEREGEETLRSSLRHWRGDVRAFAIGLVGELALVSFVEDLARIVEGGGSDKAAAVDALRGLASESERARALVAAHA